MSTKLDHRSAFAWPHEGEEEYIAEAKANILNQIV